MDFQAKRGPRKKLRLNPTEKLLKLEIAYRINFAGYYVVEIGLPLDLEITYRIKFTGYYVAESNCPWT